MLCRLWCVCVVACGRAGVSLSAPASCTTQQPPAPQNRPPPLAPAAGSSVVMCQAFGRDALPVDTHIHRLAQRWGLTGGRSVEQTETDLKTLFDRPLWRVLHLQIIYFGREVCVRAHMLAVVLLVCVCQPLSPNAPLPAHSPAHPPSQLCPAKAHDPSACPICSWAAVPPYDKAGASPAKAGGARRPPTPPPPPPPPPPPLPRCQSLRPAPSLHVSGQRMGLQQRCSWGPSPPPLCAPCTSSAAASLGRRSICVWPGGEGWMRPGAHTCCASAHSPPSHNHTHPHTSSRHMSSSMRHTAATSSSSPPPRAASSSPGYRPCSYWQGGGRGWEVGGGVGARMRRWVLQGDAQLTAAQRAPPPPNTHTRATHLALWAKQLLQAAKVAQVLVPLGGCK